MAMALGGRIKTMNNCEAYLREKMEKNAKLFAAERITISPESLKMVIRNAYNEGYRDGKAESNMFDSLFGKSK